MGITKRIRKYSGGGLGHLSDTRIPKAEVQVYVRTATGETFYLPSLHEGILHLLSNEGSRLGVYEYPDGAGFGPNQHQYAIVVRRDHGVADGATMSVEIRAPMIADHLTLRSLREGESRIHLDLSPPPPLEKRGTVEVVPLEDVLGMALEEAAGIDESSLTEEIEVTIG